MLLKIEECYQLQGQDRRAKLIQGIGQMQRSQRERTMPEPNAGYSERILATSKTYSENINIRWLSY